MKVSNVIVLTSDGTVFMFVSPSTHTQQVAIYDMAAGKKCEIKTETVKLKTKTVKHSN